MASLLSGLVLSTGLIGCAADAGQSEDTAVSLGADLAKGWKQVPVNGAPGGTFTSDPSVAIRGPDQVDLFARGTDNAVWENYAFTYDHWTTWTWLGWTPLDGVVLGKPSVSTWGIGQDDSLIVAGRDSSGRIEARVWKLGQSVHGSWSSWSPVSDKTWTGEPAVTFQYPYFFVFAKGDDNGLYWSRNAVLNGAFDPDGWSAWSAPVPNGVLSSDAAVATSNGALYVAARDANNLYRLAKSTDKGATWTDWSSVPSSLTFASAPALTISPDGRLDIFGTADGNGELWNATSADGGISWTAFQSTGRVLRGAPAGASPTAGLVQTFGLGTDSTVYWNRVQD
jgi:hypothetical protein